jgi:hypothetical protein
MARRDWRNAAARLDATRSAFPGGDLEGQLTLLLAQSRHQAGELGPAQSEYERALAGGDPPQKAAAALGLSQILRSLGNLERAGQLLDDLLRGQREGQLARCAST